MTISLLCVPTERPSSPEEATICIYLALLLLLPFSMIPANCSVKDPISPSQGFSVLGLLICWAG